MITIKNIQTKRSDKQIEDEWAKVIATKKSLLRHTDWTQLQDVNLDNKKDFLQWRKELRDLNIRKSFNNTKEAFSFLEDYKKKIPNPIFKNDKSNEENIKLNDVIKENKQLKESIADLNILVHQLKDSLLEEFKNRETAIDKDTIEEIGVEESIKFIVSEIKKEKHNKLINEGALTFSILASKMEQAVDFLSSDSTDLDSYSLLNNDSSTHDRVYAKNVIEDYKNKRKQLNNIESSYLQKEQSVYNMSSDDINEFFVNNGHRYRCIQ